MANILEAKWVVSIGSGGTPFVAFSLPGGASWVDDYEQDSYALEYDIFITDAAAMLGRWSDLQFVKVTRTTTDPATYADESLPVDQEGFGGVGTASIDALLARASGRWYRRVHALPPPTSTWTYSNLKVGIWGTTSAAVSGTIQLKLANVRVTRFRETVLWNWRDGMAAPTLLASASVTNPAAATPTLLPTATVVPALLNYYAGGAPKPLDDIRHDRRVGGRLNSTLFWDWTRDAFVLTGIRLDEQGRWDLRTFYDLFRGESFMYRHQANLPGMWCRFNGPPQFDMVVVGSKVFYDTTISLLQR